jgi:hypothetical protein
MSFAATAMTLSPLQQAIADAVRSAASAANVFGEEGKCGETTGDGAIVLAKFNAANSTEPAQYRVENQGEDLYVSLVMSDRWQSHSIEADLLNTGDHIEELIAEELAELGYQEQNAGESLSPCAHYRSEDKLFTFRSKLPARLSESRAARVASAWLLAYEAAFRALGDIDAGAEGGHH